MVTRKSTDSLRSALAANDPRLALDVNPDSDPNECPPSFPNCGPVPGVEDPAAESPERAAPTAR